jgi:hypothetical protein
MVGKIDEPASVQYRCLVTHSPCRVMAGLDPAIHSIGFSVRQAEQCSSGLAATDLSYVERSRAKERVRWCGLSVAL